MQRQYQKVHTNASDEDRKKKHIRGVHPSGEIAHTGREWREEEVVERIPGHSEEVVVVR
jgi:hypothetical protein